MLSTFMKSKSGQVVRTSRSSKVVLFSVHCAHVGFTGLQFKDDAKKFHGFQNKTLICTTQLQEFYAKLRYIIDEIKVVIDIVGGLKLLYRHLQDYKTKHTQVQNSCNGAYWLRFFICDYYNIPTNAIIGVRHSSLTLQEYLTFLFIGLGIPSFDMLCARKSYGGILKKVIFPKMSVTGVLFRDDDVYIYYCIHIIIYSSFLS